MGYNKSWLVSAVIPPRSEDYARKCSVIVHPDVIEKHFKAKNYPALGQFSGLIGRDAILENSTSIFQGIKRPFHSAGVDNFVFVYIAKPSLTYTFPLDGRGDPDKLIAPLNSVFVTFVSLSRPVVEAVQERVQTPDGLFRGVILGWEWTLESPEAPVLPMGFHGRYKKHIWSRPLHH